MPSATVASSNRMVITAVTYHPLETTVAAYLPLEIGVATFSHMGFEVAAFRPLEIEVAAFSRMGFEVAAFHPLEIGVAAFSHMGSGVVAYPLEIKVIAYHPSEINRPLGTAYRQMDLVVIANHPLVVHPLEIAYRP